MVYIDCGFHDTVIHGFQYKPSIQQDFLILDIDYVHDFGPLNEGFYLIPSNLIFTDITDLKVNFEWDDTNFSIGCLTNPMVNQLKKREIKQRFKNPYYEWVFEFLDEPNILTFGSTGYTLEHRMEPIWSKDTYLSTEARS